MGCHFSQAFLLSETKNGDCGARQSAGCGSAKINLLEFERTRPPDTSRMRRVDYHGHYTYLFIGEHHQPKKLPRMKGRTFRHCYFSDGMPLGFVCAKIVHIRLDRLDTPPDAGVVYRPVTDEKIIDRLLSCNPSCLACVSWEYSRFVGHGARAEHSCVLNDRDQVITPNIKSKPTNGHRPRIKILTDCHRIRRMTMVFYWKRQGATMIS